MKKFIYLCGVALLPGIAYCGSSEPAPVNANQPMQPPPAQVLRTSTNNVPAAPVLRHVSEAQPKDAGVYQRISEGRLLKKEKPARNYSYSWQAMFHSDNSQMGETCIRDTVVTIFPDGR